MGKYNRVTNTSKPTKDSSPKSGFGGQIIAKKPVETIKTETKGNDGTLPLAKNIYQKVQSIRSAIAELDIKRSGQNKDKGFTYLELPEYLPTLNRLMDEVGLMTMFNMTNEKAVLKIFNSSDPREFLEWELPMAELKMADAEGKEAEGIQIMGGKTTYMRRYLLQIAFEISVKDTVDSRGKTSKPVDDLDEEDIEDIESATDIDRLGEICKKIRGRKGFKKNVQLINHYTAKKELLEL